MPLQQLHWLREREPPRATGEHREEGPQESIWLAVMTCQKAVPRVSVKKEKAGQSLKRERKEGEEERRRETGRDHMVSEGQGQVKGHGASERALSQKLSVTSRCVAQETPKCLK